MPFIQSTAFGVFSNTITEFTHVPVLVLHSKNGFPGYQLLSSALLQLLRILCLK